MTTKKEQVRNVLSKCFSKKDEQFPSQLALDEITKIQFSAYSSDDVYTMELFIATNAQNANNKPYKYRGKLSVKQIITFKSLIKEVVTADAQDTDLFLNTPHGTVNTPVQGSISMAEKLYNDKPSPIATTKPINNKMCPSCGNEFINGDCGGDDCI